MLNIHGCLRDCPILVDLNRARIFAHAFIVLHLDQADLGHNLVSRGYHFALGVFLLDGFVNPDSVACFQTLGGSKRNPDLFAFNEFHDAFHIFQRYGPLNLFGLRSGRPRARRQS